MIRDKDGVWRYPMSEPATPKAPQGGAGDRADVGQGAEKPPLAWRIAGLRIGGESYLTTADALNPDMVAPRLRIEKLDIGALGSDQPMRDTPFDIVLRPDEFSEIVVSGEVRPLAPELYIDAKGHLHGFRGQDLYRGSQPQTRHLGVDGNILRGI